MVNQFGVPMYSKEDYEIRFFFLLNQHNLDSSEQLSRLLVSLNFPQDLSYQRKR